MIKGSWKKILKSLELVSKFRRHVFRLTLVKDINMNDIKEYASLINKYKPKKIECKGYVWVGHSKERLEKHNMPYHMDVLDFSKKLAELTGYKITNQKKESRVVLLTKD